MFLQIKLEQDGKNVKKSLPNDQSLITRRDVFIYVLRTLDIENNASII